MKKIALPVVLASMAGVTQAEETRATKTVHAAVLEVDDLHQDIDMPKTATSCANGQCESQIAIVFPGEVQGRVNKQRNPEHWQPGCIAVDEQGRI
jgi:hypothetical protein